jgi:hypothetical protein
MKIGGSGKNQAGLPPFWRGRKPPATRPRALWQIFPVFWMGPGSTRWTEGDSAHSATIRGATRSPLSGNRVNHGANGRHYMVRR